MARELEVWNRDVSRLECFTMVLSNFLTGALEQNEDVACKVQQEQQAQQDDDCVILNHDASHASSPEDRTNFPRKHPRSGRNRRREDQVGAISSEDDVCMRDAGAEKECELVLRCVRAR